MVILAHYKVFSDKIGKTFKKEVPNMGGTIAIVDDELHLLTSLGISQTGSTYQAVLLEDGSYLESPVTKSEACWTYNYHPIWVEVGWNPWRWLEQAEKIKITQEVVWELEGVKLLIECLPFQEKSRSLTESGYFAATPENAAEMVTWIIDWASQPKAKYIVCTGK